MGQEIRITLKSDDPKVLKTVAELKQNYDKGKPRDTRDTLTLEFFCDDPERAPQVTARNDDTGEIYNFMMKSFTLNIPTTFHPTPGGIACLIGDKVAKIYGHQAKRSALIIRKRMRREDISMPSQIVDDAFCEVVTLTLPEKTLSVKKDYKTADLSEALGISVATIRHHLRNLRSEGFRIGDGNSWESEEEFCYICELIKPRIDAHGRRS